MQLFNPEFPGGAIPSELNQYIEACANTLVATAWHPHRTRPFLRIRLWKLGRAKAEMTEALAEERRTRLDWDLIWIPQ